MSIGKVKSVAGVVVARDAAGNERVLSVGV